MLKTLKNLKNIQVLTKNEKQSIQGARGNSTGVCIINGIPHRYYCHETCPNGQSPICAGW